MSNINMETIFLAIGLMTILISIMAIGLFFGRDSIKGSCGGSGGCTVCSGGSCETADKKD